MQSFDLIVENLHYKIWNFGGNLASISDTTETHINPHIK